ncbi:hypothetical protein MTO96_017651 [Rhipicephalus appendiculatus]
MMDGMTDASRFPHLLMHRIRERMPADRTRRRPGSSRRPQNTHKHSHLAVPPSDGRSHTVGSRSRNRKCFGPRAPLESTRTDDGDGGRWLMECVTPVVRLLLLLSCGLLATKRKSKVSRLCGGDHVSSCHRGGHSLSSAVIPGGEEEGDATDARTAARNNWRSGGDDEIGAPAPSACSGRPRCFGRGPQPWAAALPPTSYKIDLLPPPPSGSPCGHFRRTSAAVIAVASSDDA